MQSKKTKKTNKKSQQSKKQIQQSDDSQQEQDIVYTKKDQEEAQQQIEFTLIAPAETMYHSIKNLLQPYAQATDNKVHELADLIVKQTEFGVAVIEDEPDDDGLDTVFSISTFISASTNQLTQGILKQFIKKCKKHCKESQSIQKMITDSQKVCLLINERFINMPPSLVPMVHATLKSDLKELKKLNPVTFSKINCDYLIVTTAGSIEGDGSKSDDLERLIYKKFQDYELLRNSQGYWTYPEQDKLIGKQTNLVIQYVISREKYLQCVQRIPGLLE